MAGEGVLDQLTPVVGAIDRVRDVFSHPKPKATSDQAADLIDARDTSTSIRQDRKSPLWQRLLSHGLAGATVGGLGLGAKMGGIAGGITGHALSGAKWGAGLGALLGAGTGVASELFDRATEARRLGLAKRVIDSTTPELRDRLRSKDVKEPATAYATARGYPMRGAELGALLGSVGGATLGAHRGATTDARIATASRYGLIGGGVLGAAGLLIGALMKRKRRQELVNSLTAEKTGSIWVEDNDVKLKTPTGGRPIMGSNRRLMGAMAGKVQQFSAGKEVHQRPKVAEENIAHTPWVTLPGGISVELVDGVAVRNAGHTEFIGGGHWLVYPWIPANTIWIDTEVPESDRPMILRHECTEIGNMRSGESYNKAHDAANVDEGKARAAAQKIAAFLKRSETPELPKLRSRSEVCVYGPEGILGIKKDGYILFPGGGIDDGETPEFGAYRETIEEADRKLLHLKAMGTSECIWPEDMELVPGYDGSRTYHFLALDGGELGTEHEDNEEFSMIPFDEALAFLDECMDRDDQEWAEDQNEIRRQCIEEAKNQVEAGYTNPVKLASEKTADPVSLLDRSEYVTLNPAGQVLVAPDKNKRFRFPTAGAGKPAPYEPVLRYIPPEGVPEAGAHGYNVRLHVGEGDGQLEGGVWSDPQAVLKQMYGAMGIKANAGHRDLDRARVRVLLRALKKRQQAQPAV